MTTAVDGIDAVAVVGVLGVAAAAVALSLGPAAASTLLAGLVCALAVRRLYDGRVREALGWLAWLVAAVLVGVGPGGRPSVLAGFVGSLVAGVVLHCLGRFDARPGAGPLDRDGD